MPPVPSGRITGGVYQADQPTGSISQRHMKYAILILEEGNWPYPRCPKCDMLIYQRSLDGKHPYTDLC